MFLAASVPAACVAALCPTLLPCLFLFVDWLVVDRWQIRTPSNVLAWAGFVARYRLGPTPSLDTVYRFVHRSAVVKSCVCAATQNLLNDLAGGHLFVSTFTSTILLCE